MDSNRVLTAGIAIGGIIGVLAGILLGAWFDVLSFTESVWAAAWSGIAGILGAAIGGVLAVIGAVKAAQMQVSSQLARAEKDDLIDYWDGEVARTMAIIEELADLETALQPLIAAKMAVARRAAEIREGRKGDVDSRSIMQTLRHECVDVVSTPVPSTRTCGVDIRQRWQTLRHLCRGLSESLANQLKSGQMPDDDFVLQLFNLTSSTLHKYQSALSDSILARKGHMGESVEQMQEFIGVLRWGRTHVTPPAAASEQSAPR